MAAGNSIQRDAFRRVIARLRHDGCRPLRDSTLRLSIEIVHVRLARVIVW